MARKKIDLKTSILEVLTLMSEGNPGAANVLGQMMQKDPDTGLIKILHLDDMNIRGTQIWLGFKDHCGQDMERFMQAILDRDQQMVDEINFFDDANHTEIAVTSNASFNR